MLSLLKRVLLFGLILVVGYQVWGFLLSRSGGRNEEAPARETIQEEVLPLRTERSPEGDQLLLSLPDNPFAGIDQHARNTPASAAADIHSLAQYLGRTATTELEKARAVYVWIAENIRYDDAAFNSGKLAALTAEQVLETRKAVCDGFSNLFVALGEALALEIEKVGGYAKGYGYATGSSLQQANHAWNIIRIDGQWKLFDATWGAGHGQSVNGKLVTVKEFDDYWFDVDPYEAIFSHFPEDNSLAFVQPSLSLRQYQQLPYVRKNYFELGFNGKQTYAMALADPGLQFPEIYEVDTYVRAISAPELGRLHLDEPYEFEFFVPRAYKMALIDSRDQWAHFEGRDGRFRLRYVPEETGEVKIGVQHENSRDAYEMILVYQVAPNNEPI